MDVTSIQQAVAQAKKLVVDWRGRSTSAFRPDRDLHGARAVAWWDASKLPGANGSLCSAMPDDSGNGQAMFSGNASRPTLNTNALNGLSTLTFSGANWMTSLGTAWATPVETQPLTMVALVKLRAGADSSQIHTVMASIGTSVGMAINATLSSGVGYDSWLYPYAGGSPLGGGGGLIDGQWHLLIIKMNSRSATCITDGLITQASVNNYHGTNDLTGQLVLGAFSAIPQLPFDGDFAEGGIIAGDLSLKQCEAVVEYFRAKWNYGPAKTPKLDTVGLFDFADANGQSYRMFRSAAPLAANPPLFILNHQQGGTIFLQPGVVSWTLAYALANAGYVVVVPNNHGTDSWSSAAAVADGPAVEAAAAAQLGVTFSRVVLYGHSMGGLLAAVQAKLATFTAPVKGVYIVDGAVNAWWDYALSGYAASVASGFGLVSGALSASASVGATSISSSVSYPSGTKIVVDPGGAHPEFVTTSGAPTGTGPYAIPVPALAFAHASGAGLSDFPAKVTAQKRDPCAWAIADIPTGLRWRFMASSNDATVSKVNSIDVFRTLLATAGSAVVESGLLTHSGGHLEVSAFHPDDVVAFADRCV